MKKFYNVTIHLTNKDKSQIPEEVRNIFEKPIVIIDSHNIDYYDGIDFYDTVYQDGEKLPGTIYGMYGVESAEELKGIIEGLLARYKKDYFDITIGTEECIIEDLIEDKEEELQHKIVSNYMKKHTEYYGQLEVREYNRILRDPPEDLYYQALVEELERLDEQNNNE